MPLAVAEKCLGLTGCFVLHGRVKTVEYTDWGIYNTSRINIQNKILYIIVHKLISEVSH